MDCDRTRELLSDYLGGELSDGDRDGVAAHVDGCPSCAAEAEGLAQTLALLSALPPEKAPRELLDRIMKGIARETEGARGGRRLLAPLRFRIPIEAAAAVFLLLLVYGIQKEMPVRPGAPEGGSGGPPEVSTPAPGASPRLPSSASSPAAKSRGSEPSSLAGSEKAARPVMKRESPRAPTAEETPLPAGSARADSRDAGPPPAGRETETLGAAAPARRAAPSLPAAPAFPMAPASRVSSAEERIEPQAFAAPPSRMLKAVPFGRDITLDVTPAGREGLEARIVAAAERLGGGAHPGAASPHGESAYSPFSGAVRVHLPAKSAGAFLDALNTLGTIPAEGMPGAADFPAGPSPGIVAYTVLIRVR